MLIENYFSCEPWPPHHRNVYWNYGLDHQQYPPSPYHRRTSSSSSSGHSSSPRSPDVCRNTLSYHIARASTSSSPSSSSMESLYSSNSTSTLDFDDDEKGFRRVSVIVKATAAKPVLERRVITLEHVCRWEGCYRIFETLDKLANHVNASHSAIGLNNLYYCKWESCQRQERGFNARYKMLIHCRTHTKEKPHHCKFNGCTKSFSRAENLKIHVRSHTLEKPYRCNYPGCTKAYSNSSDRFKHSRTHQNNKPYVCKVAGCAKRYTDPSSLRKHLKTFNHDSLKQVEVVDSETTRDDADEPTDDDEIMRPSSEYFWIKQSESLINGMEIIKLDQPLDLRINI